MNSAPIVLKSSVMSSALRRAVPLNTICSRKCDTPKSAGSCSSRAPVRTWKQTEIDSRSGICWPRIWRPLGRVWWSSFVGVAPLLPFCVSVSEIFVVSDITSLYSGITCILALCTPFALFALPAPVNVRLRMNRINKEPPGNNGSAHQHDSRMIARANGFCQRE